VWITVVVMGLAIGLEPFRIGMTILMLNRPRPVLQLFAFLCGGFAMGMTVGLVVLFAVPDRLLGSTHFTLPKVQLTIGTLALLAAVYLWLRPNSPADDEPGWPARSVGRLTSGSSLWMAAAAGLLIALPSIDFLAVLAVILASGSSAATQVGALLVFQVVALALVEIPLVAYLLAPERTLARMSTLNEWMRARRRREIAVLLAIVGGVLVTAGAIGL
jgi:hypothetical protein